MVHLVSVNLKDTLVATSSRICVPPSSSVGLWPDQPRLICDHFWQWGQDFVKEESQIDHMCCIGLEETRSSALCGGLGANYNSKSWCIFKSTSTSTLYSPSHDASLIIYPYMYPACQSRKQNPALLIAKVCFAQCSTSRLALGSPGCSSSSPCPEYLIKPYNAIFLKSPGSKDIKTDIPNCQIHKYTNTHIQIHKYSLWRSARNTKHMLYF